MSTNVPPVVYTSAGFVAPAETDILAGVQADIQAAFAPGLPAGYVLNFTTNDGSNTNPTPQGELAESQTAIIAAVDELLILYSNLIDPAFSYGRMQDAIGRIAYVSRNQGNATIATVNCIGIGNANPSLATMIPAGATIQDANGVLCTTLSGGSIPASGNVNLPFQANIPGPVVLAAPIEIMSSIPGWNKVTLVSQIEGTLTETSQAFEKKRSQSTSKNAAGAVANIVGAVLSVPGVVDCRGMSNPSNASQTILPSGQPIGITMEQNSIYIVVVGGTAQAIAQAIFSRWMPGAPLMGSQSVVVTDTGSALALPYPTYTMNFDYATQLKFVINVSVSNINIPAGAVSLIQNAVASAFTGEDVVGYNTRGAPIYGPSAKVGGLYLASRLYPTVTQVLWPGASLLSITINSTNDTAAVSLAGYIDNGLGGGTFNDVAGTVLTVTEVMSGALAVGQNLIDLVGGIAPGTQIAAQISGASGGVGTYSVSVKQAIASENALAISAIYSEVLPNANQLPTITAADVNVTFVTPRTS